jgi:hypothetical protein
MSTEPVSGSPYIIICSVETEVATAENRSKKIVAVSKGAERLVSWMQSYYDSFDPNDALSISTIQHQLMDFAKGETQLTHQQVDNMIDALLAEFHELEDKY